MLRRLFNSVTLVILVGIAIRLVLIAFIDFSTFNWSEPKPDILMEYGVIARNMANGLGYSYTWYDAASTPIILPSAYMPPALVFLEFGIIEIFGYTHAALVAIFLLQVGLGVATIWLIGRIAEVVFGSRAIASTSRWLMALYPPFIYSAVTFGITSLVLFTGALVIYSAIKLTTSIRSGAPYTKISIVLGFACGLLMLSRGEGPLFVLLTLSLVWFSIRHLPKFSFRSLAMPLAIAILMLAPWTIRNYLVFDRFIPISSNGSMNFWRGNNELSSGSPLTETGDPLWSSDEISIAAELQASTGAMYESNLSHKYMDAATEWIESNPGKAILLAAKKGLIFWTVDFRNKLGGWWYIVLHFLALGSLILGITRLIKNRKHLHADARAGVRLMAGWAILTTVIAMIFIPLTRFQITTMAMLVPIASYGIVHLFERPEHKT